MITEWGRRNLKVILEPIASVFRTLHITPNVITLLGFLLNVVAAYLIVIDQIFWAGVLPSNVLYLGTPSYVVL